MDLNLRKKLVKCYIWSIALCGGEAWTFQKVDQKYVVNSEMWCWRRMEIFLLHQASKIGVKLI
jgi:hypothetical protein